MSNRKISYEIGGEIITKIFSQIEDSLNIESTSSNNNIIKDKEIQDKIKLTEVNFNCKNPYLSKVKKIRKGSLTNN